MVLSACMRFIRVCVGTCEFCVVWWVGGGLVGIKLLCHSLLCHWPLTKFCFLLGSTLPFFTFCCFTAWESPYTKLAEFLQGVFCPPGPSPTPLMPFNKSEWWW